MNNVRSIYDATTSSRQAEDWVILFANGEVSNADHESFKAWLRKDPMNQIAFDEFKASWDRILAMGDYHRTAAEDNPDPDTVARYLSSIESGRWRRRRIAWTAAAAAMVMVAVSGWILYPTSSSTLYHTDVGERMTITLADRSTLELNTATELMVEFSDRTRTIQLLRGEAFFDVEHDDERPFVVQAGLGAIRAIGTGFAVRVTRNNLVQVTVKEGIVEVMHDAQTVPSSVASTGEADELSPPTLAEGERVEYDGQVGSPAKVAPEELLRNLAWRQGLLIFNDDSLSVVIQEVARYTDIRIVIADQELQELRVGGVFPAGDIEPLLEFLAKGMNIDVKRHHQRTVYLTAARSVTRQ